MTCAPPQPDKLSPDVLDQVYKVRAALKLQTPHKFYGDVQIRINRALGEVGWKMSTEPDESVRIVDDPCMVAQIAVLGRFPVGVPVLIHDQLNGDGLETHIGIITKCEDPLCLAETYYGKISAIIVTGTLQTNSVTGLEHYSKRISACYWLHLSEADLMSEDFACSWNADEVRERVEYLMASVRPNDEVCGGNPSASAPGSHS